MPTVLVVLPEGFEEIETITPIDVLRRAEIAVTTAALGDGIHVSGRSGITLHADTLLSQVAGSTLYDALLLPGGPGVKLLRADPRVKELVQRHQREGRLLAAICAAPTVLLDAGVLQGKSYTCHPSVGAELPARLAAERVVEDGLVVTSRGAGTALDFSLALVARLRSSEVAQSIHQAICA